MTHHVAISFYNTTVGLILKLFQTLFLTSDRGDLNTEVPIDDDNLTLCDLFVIDEHIKGLIGQLIQKVPQVFVGMGESCQFHIGPASHLLVGF